MKSSTSLKYMGRCAPRLPVKPFKQVEGHTCGLRTMQALYAYYGLNSSPAALGARLGTDHSTPVFLPARKLLEEKMQKWGLEWEGTWPHDIFLVLGQDGFQVKPLSGILSPEALPVLNREIKNRYPVLLLTLHPVFHLNLLCGVTRQGAWIACSLGPKVYFQSWANLEHQVIGMAAIRPTERLEIGPQAAFKGQVCSDNPTNSLSALTSATTWVGKLFYQWLLADKGVKADDWDDDDDWDEDDDWVEVEEEE
jgi:hypothetical protein